MHTRSRTIALLSATALAVTGTTASAQAARSTAKPGQRVAPVLHTLRDTGNALGVTLGTAGRSIGTNARDLGNGTATPESVRRNTERTISSLLGTVAVAVGGVSKTVGAISGSDCGDTVSQPFAPWNDVADYTLAPGGSFEGDATLWQSLGGELVADQEPWRVNGAADAQALQLSAGGTALSPPLCAGLTHPTLRLFARGSGSLRVDVLYPDTEGLLRSATVGSFTAGPEWEPTHQMLTLSGLPLLTGASFSIRLTASGGPVTVDDVYVDPARRR